MQPTGYLREFTIDNDHPVAREFDGVGHSGRPILIIDEFQRGPVWYSNIGMLFKKIGLPPAELKGYGYVTSESLNIDHMTPKPYWTRYQRSGNNKKRHFEKSMYGVEYRYIYLNALGGVQRTDVAVKMWQQLLIHRGDLVREHGLSMLDVMDFRSDIEKELDKFIAKHEIYFSRYSAIRANGSYLPRAFESEDAIWHYHPTFVRAYRSYWRHNIFKPRRIARKIRARYWKDKRNNANR